MSHDAPYDIVPAHLDFLSIYSPDLDDESQLVFHYTNPKPHRTLRRKDAQENDEHNHDQEQQEHHRRMRQIGLAQGMVNFARSFSGNSDVDSVESEKHRTVLAQFEKGWWILASIRLTCIKSRDLSATTSKDGDSKFEYSAREVSPPTVLAQQLARAYRIFTLHQSHSLSDLFVRLQRPRFCALLDKFWTKFADSWDVMLHGNPVADALGGIRLAGGGELGIGVGEEEWGSAEREYLEELIRSTDSLVDMVVCRASTSLAAADKTGKAPEASVDAMADGVVFSGVRALGPQSLRAITDWVASIATNGSNAYGVDENPISSRKKARRPRTEKQVSTDLGGAGSREETQQAKADQDGTVSRSGRVSIPPPLIPPISKSPKQSKDPATSSTAPKPQTSPGKGDGDGDGGADEQLQTKAAHGSSDGWVNYLTLGYGNKWAGSNKKQSSSETHPATMDEKSANRDNKPDVSSAGRFLIGFTGPLVEQAQASAAADDDQDAPDSGGRLSVRTIHVEVFEAAGAVKISDADAESSARQEEIAQKKRDGTPILVKKRLRLIIYLHEPFIYALMFGPEEASLAIPSFYRELHRKLQPLHKALTVSTSPARASERIQAQLPPRVNEATASPPIYDLVYDPASLVLRTSLPDIPSFSERSTSESSSPAKPPWSRLDALNVYTHTLALLADTRKGAAAYERSTKTSRDWWVTWLQLPVISDATSADPLPVDQGGHPAIKFRDAILVRKASDGAAAGRQSRGATSALGRLSLSSGSAGLGRLIGRDSSSGSADSGDASRHGDTQSARLVEGVGVDARLYLNSLFNLHR